MVFVVTEKPTLDLKGRTHTFCHAIPARWHNTGVTQSAGLSLRWFRDNVGENKSYDDLTEETAKIAAGSDGVIWLPYLMGERTPHLDAKARAAFVGLTASHRRAHLTRASLYRKKVLRLLWFVDIVNEHTWLNFTGKLKF